MGRARNTGNNEPAEGTIEAAKLNLQTIIGEIADGAYVQAGRSAAMKAEAAKLAEFPNGMAAIADILGRMAGAWIKSNKRPPKPTGEHKSRLLCPVCKAWDAEYKLRFQNAATAINTVLHPKGSAISCASDGKVTIEAYAGGSKDATAKTVKALLDRFPWSSDAESSVAKLIADWSKAGKAALDAKIAAQAATNVQTPVTNTVAMPGNLTPEQIAAIAAIVAGAK